MPHIDRHAPGSFCFVELGSTDQQQAKHFYEPLFGWSSFDLPMGPDRFYTLFQIDGRIAAAAYTMTPQERAAIPAHWQLYVAVENADQAAARVTELGGKRIEGPFDVGDQGRMAVAQDPTGAYFSVWQAKNGIGIQVAGVNGTLCWADLNTRDQNAAKSFYEGMFGWQIELGANDDSGYLHIRNGADFIGGIPPAHFLTPGVPPHWLPYFLVEDIDAAAAKVPELGGQIHMPPTAVQNVGRMAVAADAQGAVFALFKMSH